MDRTIEIKKIIEHFEEKIFPQLHVSSKGYIKICIDNDFTDCLVASIQKLKLLNEADEELPLTVSGGKPDEDIPDNKEEAYSAGYFDGQEDYKQVCQPVVAKLLGEIEELRKIADLAWNFILDARGSWDTYEGERCLDLIEKYRKTNPR